MSADFVIESPSGVVVLCDASILPSESATIAELKERAKSGDVFLIDAETEESSRYRIRVLNEEELPEELRKLFENTGGSFRLNAPSGTLVFSAGKALDKFSLSPGHYLLQAMMPRPFDNKDYRMRREKLLGASDLRFARFVERLAVGGCLITLFAALLLIISFWRQHKWTIIAAAAFPWLIHFILRSLPRYRRIEKAMQAADQQVPHFILHLKRSLTAQELPGGWIRGRE